MIRDGHNDEYWALLGHVSDVLAEKTEAAISDRIVLRDAACAFVAAEHERGTPLEAVIETVRSILKKAEKKGNASASNSELALQLIEWCKEFHGSRVVAPT